MAKAVKDGTEKVNRPDDTFHGSRGNCGKNVKNKSKKSKHEFEGALFQRNKRTRRTRPVNGTQEEWAKWFCEQMRCPIKPLANEFVTFYPEHGFLSFVPMFDDKVMFIHCMGGDGEFWVKETKRICLSLGLEKIVFTTKHNPRVVERMTKARTLGYLLEVNVDDVPSSLKQPHKNKDTD